MNTEQILAIVIGVLLIGLGALACYYIYQGQNNPEESAGDLTDRIGSYGDIGEDAASDPSLKIISDFGNTGELKETIYNLMAEKLPPVTPELADKLNKAGRRNPEAYYDFVFDQLMYTFLLCVFCLMMTFVSPENATMFILLGLPLSAVVGIFLLPSSKLSGQVKERAKAIDRLIPDMIDMFANCCQGGISFDAAARFVLSELGEQKSLTAGKEDFTAWLSDINFGMGRSDAWKRMAERTDSENMSYFTSLMDQSEKTGGSIAESLFKMSSFFRERRKQALEADIAGLPGGMANKTIFFIVLPVFVMLIAPLGIYFGKMMSGMGG